MEDKFFAGPLFARVQDVRLVTFFATFLMLPNSNMMRISILASTLWLCSTGVLGCKRTEELPTEKGQAYVREYAVSSRPDVAAPTLLEPGDCKVRLEETEGFTCYFRNDRLALKIRQSPDIPLCYLFGPESIFAIVVLNKPESPTITTEPGLQFQISIETLPGGALRLTAMDGDPFAFFESYVLTRSTVSLVGASEYAKQVNELRKFAAAISQD